MKKASLLAGMFGMMAALSEDYPKFDDTLIIKKKLPKEKPKPGQFYYWFRNDGTFLSNKQEERMLREDCIFTCFSINDKNAIRKFKNRETSCQS